MALNILRRSLYRLLLLLALLPALLPALPAGAVQVAQTPLYLTQQATPLAMINLSRDHQLFYKAYDDWSDLDGDGRPETTYKHTVDYYGYFDSHKCYSYTSGRFQPEGITLDKYCSGQWSGNFLNWATMTRIDAVRKILYGGLRAVDKAGVTVLERSYLPTDAHSFAKYYNGSDLAKLTPFADVTTGVTGSQTSGLTFCNTTFSDSGTSQNVTNDPLLRVAQGNYALWAANERWQCLWREESKTRKESKGAGDNGNDPARTGIAALNKNPEQASVGKGEFVVRVSACVKGQVGGENCKTYPGGLKPVGLLQQYGDEEQIHFGLLTGSYRSNKDGGVLRKNVGSLKDEVRVESDGTFKTPEVGGGIITTLDALRIYGYDHSTGKYNSTDSCAWGLNSFSNGKCSNWGNPQAEIYLESLRYLAGLGPSAGLTVADSSYLSALPAPGWTSPLSNDNWCAPLSTIQFNASVTSYDGDKLGGLSDLNAGKTAQGLTTDLGGKEGINGDYFVGGSDGLCTAKSVNALGEVTGLCPEAPRLSGTYSIAGLAWFARSQDLLAQLKGDQQVTTYGVSLAPASPALHIPLPGSDQQVTILPACRNDSIKGNCAIVDFKIVAQDLAAGTGKVYVNWEDSEQGGDYDQDMAGLLEYRYQSVGNRFEVTTSILGQSTPNMMGFGYVISGVTKAGFHVHSGINKFNHTDLSGIQGCDDCVIDNAPTTAVYTPGGSGANTLEHPLYYAAKWGGFKDSNDSGTPDLREEWDADGDGQPDTYFYATDPARLAESLGEVFATVAEARASSAAAPANSTAVETGTHLYQASFDSQTWSGDLAAYPLLDNGDIGAPVWRAARQLAGLSPTERVILTSDGHQGIPLRWNRLDGEARGWLDRLPDQAADGLAEVRLDWLRGVQDREEAQGGPLRDRDSLLGDSINSAPAFVGASRFYYPDGLESASHATFRQSTGQRTPMLYVGANDGMLHGFDATTGRERLAYAPRTLLGELPLLTDPDYQHRYFVDGSPTVGDALLGGQWRTVLVGGLGAGGKAYFALDVTDPGRFEEANAAELVLWEFGHPDLGHAFSRAAIVKISDGRWAAVFGNGYGSGAGKAVLLVVDLATGSLIRAIEAGDAGANGLSTPAPVDLDGDYRIDAVFAGDLKGNLWRFDLSGASPADWGVAYGEDDGPAPLFTTRDLLGRGRPITSRPEVAPHPEGRDGVVVVFGTGSYFAVGDDDNTDRQSVYGVWDDGRSYNLTRLNLLAQTVLDTLLREGRNWRITSDLPVLWDLGQKGWYLDLPESGERMVADPQLRGDKVVFASLIPAGGSCSYGGRGWLMALNWANGGRLNYAPFDLLNRDLLDTAGLAVGELPASGAEFAEGIITAPTLLDGGEGMASAYVSMSNGEIGRQDLQEAEGAGRGRQAWQQLLPGLR